MVILEELKWDQLKQELGKRNLRTPGTKTELKQRLVEQLEKDGQDPSILEFEYKIEGREQADNVEGTGNAAAKQGEEKGEDSASILNIMQFLQQMQQQAQPQTQQQMQQQTEQMQQQMQKQTEQIKSKIDEKIQENQRILRTHIDKTHEHLDARINAQEENADAFKKEIKDL
ncbi:uncharacterized protein ACN427_003638 isoform 1-T3 [Glossina fuscipes fuscipes]